MNFIILFSGIILSIFLRVFFVVNGLDVADVKLLHEMGETVLKGTNPYLSLNFNIYPPIAVYLEAATLYFSNILNIPFHILTKLWPNLADIITTLILYKFLISQKVKPVKASLWSLLFILNPVSIIISSAHGQLDPIPSLLVLFTIYLLTFNVTRFSVYLSALLLGLAIAIKPNPVMLLPIFLFYVQKSLKQKVIFLLLIITPLTVTLSPFLLHNAPEIIKNLLNYSGVYDFGYSAILRGVWYQKNANFWLPLTNELLDASKLSFLAGAFFTFVLFIKSKDLVKSCLAIYLLFLTFYFGISAQYLIWILPLAIAAREKMIIPFSFAGIIALLGFYMFFGPDILLGKFSSGAVFQSKYMPIYVVGNLALWFITFWWFVKTIKNYFKTAFTTFSPFHKKFVKLGFVIFLIFLVPTLRLIVVMLPQLIY